MASSFLHLVILFASSCRCYIISYDGSLFDFVCVCVFALCLFCPPPPRPRVERVQVPLIGGLLETWTALDGINCLETRRKNKQTNKQTNKTSICTHASRSKAHLWGSSAHDPGLLVPRPTASSLSSAWPRAMCDEVVPSGTKEKIASRLERRTGSWRVPIENQMPVVVKTVLGSHFGWQVNSPFWSPI